MDGKSLRKLLMTEITLVMKDRMRQKLPAKLKSFLPSGMKGSCYEDRSFFAAKLRAE